MCAALQTATVGTRTILLRYEDDVDSLSHIIVGNPDPTSDLYQGNGYRECGFEWFDDTCLTVVLHWQCTRESGPVTPLTLAPSPERRTLWAPAADPWPSTSQSFTLRFLISVRTLSLNLAPSSPSPAYSPRRGCGSPFTTVGQISYTL